MDTRTSALLTALTMLACAPGVPGQLAEGTPCEFCRMAISDPRYGGAVQLTTGKVLAFDAVECLADFLAASDSTTHSAVFVSDYLTSQLVPVTTASFVHGGTLQSPMGRSVVAVSSRAAANSLARDHAATVADWSGIRAALAATPRTPAR